MSDWCEVTAWVLLIHDGSVGEKSTAIAATGRNQSISMDGQFSLFVLSGLQITSWITRYVIRKKFRETANVSKPPSMEIVTSFIL